MSEVDIKFYSWNAYDQLRFLLGFCILIFRNYTVIVRAPRGTLIHLQLCEKTFIHPFNICYGTFGLAVNKTSADPVIKSSLFQWGQTDKYNNTYNKSHYNNYIIVIIVLYIKSLQIITIKNHKGYGRSKSEWCALQVCRRELNPARE